MAIRNPFEGTTPEEFTPEHFQAIGEFITRYSALESLFIDVFINHSGLNHDMARAIVGGMRMKDVIERIKRVIKLRGLDEKILLDFEQVETLIDPLSTFRDNIVHRVWLQSAKGPVIMNLAKARSMAAITQEPVSTEELQHQTWQVVAASIRVMPHMLTDAQWWALKDEHRNLMQAPWREKRPEQDPNRSEPPRDPE